MRVRTLPVALAATLALATVEARAQRQPVHNNPLAQGSMYNVNRGPLQFNNPVNQTGMYGTDAVLRFNNPLAQGSMYGGANFNNPVYQGNFVGNGFNNPLAQGNFVGSGFNNPTVQGNFVGSGFNNPLLVGGAPGLGGFGGVGGFGAVGGFNTGMNQGMFGWGGQNFNNPLAQGNMGFGQNFNNPLMPNNLNPTGRGFSSRNVNPGASGTLNGLNGPVSRGARQRGTSSSRKSTGKKR